MIPNGQRWGGGTAAVLPRLRRHRRPGAPSPQRTAAGPYANEGSSSRPPIGWNSPPGERVPPRHDSGSKTRAPIGRLPNSLSQWMRAVWIRCCRRAECCSEVRITTRNRISTGQSPK